jgi:hypothetical protein
MKNMASSKAASPTDDQTRPIDAIICMVTGQFTHISRSSPDASWNNDLGEIRAAGRQKQGDSFLVYDAHAFSAGSESNH